MHLSFWTISLISQWFLQVFLSFICREQVWLFAELLTSFHQLELEKQENNHESITQILASEKFGPIARNIIKVWYIATWYTLPQSWRDIYGTKEKDGTFIISPHAYPEGLLWTAIGVNPPGAKGQGYGTWSEPPLVSLAKS
jgi:hypothetical protein